MCLVEPDPGSVLASSEIPSEPNRTGPRQHCLITWGNLIGHQLKDTCTRRICVRRLDSHGRSPVVLDSHVLLFFSSPSFFPSRPSPVNSYPQSFLSPQTTFTIFSRSTYTSFPADSAKFSIELVDKNKNIISFAVLQIDLRGTCLVKASITYQTRTVPT